MTQLSFGSGLSLRDDFVEAIKEARAAAEQTMAAAANFGCVFFTPEHSEAVKKNAGSIRQKLGVEHLIGCSAESIVGAAREIEVGPALAVWLAHLPNARIDPFHVEFESNSEGGSFVGWPDHFEQPWDSNAGLLLLGDPFSFPADSLLDRLNEVRKGLPIVGGLASGGHAPRQNRLLLDDEVFETGGVGVRVSGGVQLRTIVSQGCKPIGKPYVVTKAHRNIIESVGGKPVLEVLREVFSTLSVPDQQLVQAGLHVGRAISEYRDTFGPGDFLIRNVMGVDKENNGLVIGDFIRTGQTIQFHVRDASSADADLKTLIQNESSANGALLFTCNGRGTRLFAAPDHDAGVIKDAWNTSAIAGFFCAGEIGPIGGKNFLHGFTASIAVFEKAN